MKFKNIQVMSKRIYLNDTQTLEMKLFSWRKAIGLLLLSSLLGFWLGFGIISNDIIINSDGIYAIPHQKDVFTEQKLKQYLVELNVKYPNIVFAQAKLESGNFKSKIFEENNNLFGMKQPSIRATTATGEQYNHATYNSWRESVLDYALYSCKYTSGIKSESEYIAYLGSRYAEDTNYIFKLKNILK
jgi:DNA-directed RNA polymerase